tara:strand:+ start:3217 stop:4101 length:885 start_codon:yes stop_codon:yes gene_type:complete
MRIVILTDLSERHFYFCNRIIKEYDTVVGVFLGTKNIYADFFSKVKKIIKRKIFIKTIINKILNILFLNYGKKFNQEKLAMENKFFGGSKKKFYLRKNSFKLSENIDHNLNSINNKVYVDKIKDLRPDVIIVMGACLIGKEIINSAKHVINMHTGLSPYYRGGYANLWPFLNNEYGCFGVTIHEMSAGIDSGKIIYSAKPTISSNDNYGSINSKAILLGTNLMIKTIKNILNKNMNSKNQWTKGKVFHNYHFNNYIAYKYTKKRKSYICSHIKLDKQNKLNQFLLVSNGVIIDN